VEYIKGLGADVAFNYNSGLVSEFLRENGPLDLYWDNVGGESLEAAIENLNVNGRVVVSSQYLYWVSF
jgi:NADPH-dependent curcumin reductase CurA